MHDFRFEGYNGERGTLVLWGFVSHTLWDPSADNSVEHLMRHWNVINTTTVSWSNFVKTTNEFIPCQICAGVICAHLVIPEAHESSSDRVETWNSFATVTIDDYLKWSSVVCSQWHPFYVQHWERHRCHEILGLWFQARLWTACSVCVSERTTAEH